MKDTAEKFEKTINANNCYSFVPISRLLVTSRVKCKNFKCEKYSKRE